MREQEVLSALQRMRDASKPRKFEQSVEFILNFRGIDFKKADKRINAEITFPFPTGKGSKANVAVFVQDKGFAEQLKAKKANIILVESLEAMNKKEAEKLATSYDAFIAEGPAMIPVGKYLGQILAPKKKMPRPIPMSISAYENALSQLSTTVKVSNAKGKNMPVVQVLVGKEKGTDKQLTDNIFAAYNAIIPNLERKEQNVKSAYVKLTMGPAIKIGTKASDEKEAKDAFEKLKKSEAEVGIKEKGDKKAEAATKKLKNVQEVKK